MFNKFLPLKRQNTYDGTKKTETSKSKPTCHRLDKSKIRLVIIADSDRRRTPFFDSNAIQLVEDVEKKPSSRLRSRPKTVLNKALGSNVADGNTLSKDGPKCRFLNLGSDVKVLEEMMFGTAPMAYMGSSLKIHVLKSPHELMITKVFIPEQPRGESFCDTESDSMSLVNSMMDLSSGESFSIRKYKEASDKSKPVDVPKTDYSDYGTDEDNGFSSFTSSGSLPSSFQSPSNNSHSYSSLHKRWMRSQTTSFNNQRKPLLESSVSSEGSGKRKRRQKLAIAIMFGSDDEKDLEAINLFQSFVFSHFTLIEAHVEKLRAVIEMAYFNLKTFLLKTLEALDQFRQDIYNLYMAPRLAEPVWLTMMSSSMCRPHLCETFMKEFNALVTQYDKKDYKFFVSTLLSAVLTQHLTWVATVTPAGVSPTKKYAEKHSAKWVEALAKTHPYNPLWAQLGDIFGAIGPPLKISRTIVVGKKAELVKRFLTMLSYFIRCSDVQERDSPCTLRQILSDPPVEESLSPTLSDQTITNGYSSDDKSSILSLSCGRQASCSSGGTGVFSGSCQNGDNINMVPLSSSGEHICGKVTKSSSGANIQTEPNIVYCDSNLKNSFSSGTVLNGDIVSNVKDVIVIQDGSTNQIGDEKIHLENQTLVKQPQKQEKNCEYRHLSELPQGNGMDTISDPLEQVVFPSLSLNLLEDVSPSSNSNVDNCVESSSFTVIPSNSSVCDSNLAMSELHHAVMPSSTPVYSLTPLYVHKPLIVENVQLVGKSAKHVLPPEEIPRSQSFSEGKRKSKLSQQLEDDNNMKTVSTSSKPTPAEVKKLFLKGGTSSMFDEYYESDCDLKVNDVARTAPAPSLLKVPSTDGGKETGIDLKSSLARQLSIQDNKSAGTYCKSITPDISRRRHLSSTSSIDYDAFDPMTHGKEVKLPYVFSDSMQFNVQSFDKNFGRSLLAGFSEKYMSDFVLLGTSDKNFKQRVLDDLQSTVQSSFLDEHIEEAVCVIADTDTWSVEVASSKIIRSSPSGCTTWSYSKLVADLIESVVGIYKMKMGAEFCLLHLEDRLQEIYFKSFMLAEYLQDPSKFNQQELTSMLGFENSDMSLLFAVAGTHTPSLLTG